MWDQRYDTKEYVYGTEANDFLAQNIHFIPQGKILSLAEGEGRNAVFLAKQGYSVTAVDSSAIGLKKAERLAKQHGVAIECIHADLAEYDLGIAKWDGIVSIFGPLPTPLREIVHQRVVKGLKVQGVFLLEAYRPEQVNYGTGGGNSVETMVSKEQLKTELSGLEFLQLKALEREVIEGVFHTGLAAVVQAIGVKV